MGINKNEKDSCYHKMKTNANSKCPSKEPLALCLVEYEKYYPLRAGGT